AHSTGKAGRERTPDLSAPIHHEIPPPFTARNSSTTATREFQCARNRNSLPAEHRNSTAPENAEQPLQLSGVSGGAFRPLRSSRLPRGRGAVPTSAPLGHHLIGINSA